MFWMKTLRVMSIADGISYLILMLIAMPLKYLAGMPIAVTYVGWVHGALFTGLFISGLMALFYAKLPFKLGVLIGIASIIPGAPFFLDPKLKRHQSTLLPTD